MRWVILNETGDKVYNVIVADQEFINSHYPGAILIEENQPCSPGTLYIEGSFIEPEPIVVPAPEEPVVE